MQNRLSILVVAWLATVASLTHAAPPKVAALPVARPALPPESLAPSLAVSPPMDVLPAMRVPQPVAPAAAPAPATKVVQVRGGQPVSYPATAATATAIVKIATRQVSSRPNRCAATMREALGWGLGDAHEWLQLPKRGFRQRARGESAQPGDIVVWPFTFGSRRSQHIGVAVGTEAGVRLLSNLSGNICVSSLAAGYRAFYKPLPTPPPPAPSETLCHIPSLTPTPTTERSAGVVTTPTAMP